MVLKDARTDFKIDIAGHFYVLQNFILFQLTVGFRVSPLDSSSWIMDFVHILKKQKKRVNFVLLMPRRS